MKRLLLTFAFLGLVSVVAAHADRTVVEVISLKHRTAEEVIPLLAPFVGEDGVVSGVGGQLIVRAAPTNLDQIREILEKIDTAPRRLLITVWQNVIREELEGELAASGTVAIGDRGRISVGDGAGSPGATAEYGRGQDRVSTRASSTETVERSGDTQQVQVLEGTEAFIQGGTAMPVPERTVVRNRRGVTVTTGATYHEVTSGFTILPRVSGDQVILEVKPRQASIGEQGRVNIQNVSTKVSGRLGEWIEIGGILRDASGGRSGIASTASKKGSDRRGTFVKVEEVK
jgi:type II secretory pathway component HofQ